MHWQIILSLSAVAALFVLWPLLQLPFLHKSWARRASQDETQVTLYYEHLADLDKALALGEIESGQYEELKLELQKTLVADEVKSPEHASSKKGKKAVFALALLVPVLGYVIYSEMGAKPDWEIYTELQALPQATSQEEYEQDLRALALKAQARLVHTPENHALRNLLAQTSLALQDYDEAVANYRKILEVFPTDPRLMANLAQALFYRAGNTVTPEVQDYMKKSLAVDPLNPEMLGLAGIDAKTQGDLRGAIRYWKMAVSQLNPQSQAAMGYNNGIKKAEQALLAAGESLEEPAHHGQQKELTELLKIELNVAIAPGIPVAADATVFIYARAWNGPKVPLAIQKITVADLPKHVTLDESMAMAPGMTIKHFEELELVARVSLQGTPASQSGDWQASVGPIKLADLKAPVELVISKQIP